MDLSAFKKALISALWKRRRLSDLHVTHFATTPTLAGREVYTSL